MLDQDYYKMQLLPSDNHSNIFVPVIEAVDSLLVLGELKEKKYFHRLLHLLDPQLFPCLKASMLMYLNL